MATGKLTNEKLESYVLQSLTKQRKDIIVGPGIGIDCGAIEFGDLVCVATTDPITSTSNNLGNLAVNVCCNDIAAMGAEPVAILMTILCPKDTEEDAIKHIMQEADEAAQKISVEIIGGHTELTSAVNQIIISATGLGKVDKNKMIQPNGAQIGDYIYMTKYAGLEGTAIISKEKKETLKKILTSSEQHDAENCLASISVIEEGQIGANAGVSAMHDVTEGGPLGAIHELCTASHKGCKIYFEKFQILEITQKICDHFVINPLRLISSGSMLMTIDPDKAPELEKNLIESKIEYTRIGTITESTEKLMIYGQNEIEEIVETIEPPASDELYKVID